MTNEPNPASAGNNPCPHVGLYQFVPHAKIAEFEAKNWVVVDALWDTNHGAFSVLMKLRKGLVWAQADKTQTDKTQTDKWTYLGDGVYAGFDGFQIWLHANSHSNPTDRIALEPAVYDALVAYAGRTLTKENIHEQSDTPPA